MDSEKPTLEVVNTKERLLEIFRGDQDAHDFYFCVHDIAHIWDDLIDKDTEITDAQINAAFFNAIILLPNNPFARQHWDVLYPVLGNGIFNYIASNDLEKSTQQHIEIAHNARVAIGDITLTIAAIVGGYEWAASHAAELKAMANEDSIEKYMEEVRQKDGN